MNDLCFIYDTLDSDPEYILNGKMDSHLSYHLSIPTILKINNYKVKLKHIEEADYTSFFFYILTFSDMLKTFKKIKTATKLLDYRIIKALMENRCKLILSNVAEHMYGKNRYDLIDFEIRRVGLNNKNTLFVGYGVDNQQFKNIINFNYFETVVRNWHTFYDFKNVYEQREKNIFLKNIDKKFLCLNRIPRAARLVFTYLCWKNNLLKNMNFSYPKLDIKESKIEFNLFDIMEREDEKNIDDFYVSMTNNLLIKNFIVKDDFYNFLNILPLTIDTVDFKHNHWDTFHENFITNNGIYIVTETIFYTYLQHFITEKTYKPIAYKMPFIIIGQPHLLNYLRSCGFKTFHELWDESYDDELDPALRMEKIVHLIKHINSLNETDFYNTLLKAQEICEYNYNVFIERRPEKVLVKALVN